MNVKKIAAAVGLSFALGASAANAVQLWSFEDDDIDFILDPATLTPKTSGAMTVGDIFVSVFEIDPYAVSGVPSIPAGKEMTGVAAVQLQNTPAPGIGSTLGFAPYTGGLDAILDLGGHAGIGQGAGSGGTIAMWLNDDTSGPVGPDRDLDLNRTTNPATNCTSLSDCVSEASMGSLFQVDGFADPDDFWFATSLISAGTDIGAVLAAGDASLVAGFNFGQSTLFTVKGEIGHQEIATGDFCGTPGYIADGCVQLLGSGTLTGGSGLTNGAIAHSDFDATKYDIPEPSIAFLLGAGLLGMGARLSKRKA